MIPGGRALLSLFLAVAPACRDAPIDACASPEAARGKAIFQRGEVSGRPLQGALDRGGASLVGRDAACANCHGPAGLGREEGGVIVPSLRPERLYSPRERAYDGALLARALREGRTSEGIALRPPMPRFSLGDREIGDLAAYLACLGRERDPGVTDEVVRVGAALPLSGPRAEIGAAIRDALLASLADIEAAPGAARRRIELITEDTEPLGEHGAVARLVGRGIFALIAGLGGDGDDDLPRILPLGDAPSGPGPRAFHLLPPLASLSRVAVAHLAERGGKRLLVVHDGGAIGARWLASARAEANRRGLPSPREVTVGRDGALSPAAEGAHLSPDAVLIAGTGEELALGPEILARLPRAPIYTLPREGAAIGDRLWILHPGLLPSEAARGFSAVSATLRRRGFTPRHPALEAHAALAARVLTEALGRAGSPPTREGLVAAIEGLRDLETGLAPPLRFARNRHFGVTGAYVIGPSGAAWVDLPP